MTLLRTCLVTAVILLSYSVAIAQDVERIASLRGDLKGAKGEERFELLNKLAWEYRSAFPDSAIKYGQLALDLNRQLKLRKGAATSLNYIGLANDYKGNLVRAFEFYDKAMTEAGTTGDSIQLAYANNNIGRLFSEQGMLTQAFPYFVKAETLFKAVHDPSGLAYVYQSFASMYKTQKDFVKSEQNFVQALQIRKELGNTRDIMSAMVLLGKLYMEIRQFDQALLYFQRADSAGRVIDDALALAEVKILMAEYYLGTHDTNKAEQLCVEGLSYILNFKNVTLVPRAYLVLGQIHYEKKDYAVAKKYFTIALNVSTLMRYLEMKMQAHYFLWKISEIGHDRQEALTHSNEYLVLKDSVNVIHVSDRIAKFQFQIEIERKQQENEMLKVQEARNEAIIRQQDQQRIGLIFLIVLVTMLLLFQWRSALRRKEQNQKLSAQNSQIELLNGRLSEKVDEISQRNDLLSNHLTTLIDFSKSRVVHFGSMSDAAQDIARLTAHSLSVSRVSIWNYNEELQTIESVACYDLATQKFQDLITLDLTKVPAYAQALKTKRVIDAPQARTSEETKEFTDSYLIPLDIYSMLDITWSQDGQLGGLICCEQQGSPRTWKPEDIIFASSVADIIALVYRGVQRREYEKKLRQQTKEIARMNEELEQRVIERTQELENQNKKLSEYAFINAHVLRSPVSKIIGLLNLMEVDKASDPQEMMGYLKTSCNELDTVVKKITIALDGGEDFDRGLFKK
ncbi:MAG TPA: GAF domain-containing protein [Cyclobacteriaceae bacterium]|nr:GAF domain-containing protein [Cyclobacteriaceae bacterium]